MSYWKWSWWLWEFLGLMLIGAGLVVGAIVLLESPPAPALTHQPAGDRRHDRPGPNQLRQHPDWR